MSQTSFPFPGTQVGDGPGASDDDARGNRRTIVILALVGVLVVGALAYFFVFSGGDDKATDNSLPSPRSTSVVPTPTKAPAVVKAPKLSKKAVGKDPFKPLVVVAEGAAPGSAPATGGGTTVTGGGTTVTGGGTTVTGGGTTTTDGGSATSSKPLTVKVLSVAADNTSGRVTVGGKSYSVAVGDVFGTYFKTLRLKNGKCASFSYGDERFDLCEGESSRMQ
jgi:hypothetical protein